MFILGGKQREFTIFEDKPTVISCLLILKTRKCGGILDLDVFDGNFALIPLSVREGEPVTTHLAHFKNTDRVTIALPIHYLQKILRLLASQLLLVRGTDVTLVKVELFRQAVFPVLSALRLHAYGWGQHCESLFAIWAFVLVEAPRDETGAAEMMIYARVYACQVFDVFLFETDLATEGVLGLALGEPLGQFSDSLLVYVDAWLNLAAKSFRLLVLVDAEIFSHDREDIRLRPGQDHWLLGLMSSWTDNKCVFLWPTPTLGLVHLLFHLLPQQLSLRLLHCLGYSPRFVLSLRTIVFRIQLLEPRGRLGAVGLY